MKRQFLLARAECSRGFPSSDFERWYQQGMDCHMAHLPRWLRKQAFRSLVSEWRALGRTVATWQIKAFVHGASGMGHAGVRLPHLTNSFVWPSAPPPGWCMVVCAYLDGICEIDYVHPVSRRFWSDESEFLLTPSNPVGFFTRAWFRKMGFDVMDMSGEMRVAESTPIEYLTLVV